LQTARSSWLQCDKELTSGLCYYLQRGGKRAKVKVRASKQKKIDIVSICKEIIDNLLYGKVLTS